MFIFSQNKLHYFFIFIAYRYHGFLGGFQFFKRNDELLLLLRSPESRTIYFDVTLHSLNLFLCLQVAINSVRLFSVFGSLFFIISNFSETQTSHFFCPGSYFWHFFIISHFVLLTSIPLSFCPICVLPYLCCFYISHFSSPMCVRSVFFLKSDRYCLYMF